MDFPILPVTFTFIAVGAAILFPMSGWIGVYRSRTGILRGDGGDPVLFKRIRIHGNFIENAPLTALVLGASEAMGLGAVWLWLAVLSFTVGRLLHYALYDLPARGLPMGLTAGPGLLLGLWVLWKLWF